MLTIIQWIRETQTPGDGKKFGVQAEGYLDFRVRNVSASYNNDSNDPPSFAKLLGRRMGVVNNDAGWAGGIE